MGSFLLRDYQDYYSDIARDHLKFFGWVYFCFAMRSGKNVISLATIYKLDKSSNILFITKKKAIPGVISDHIMTNYGLNLKVINYESLHKIKNKDKYDIIVIDEAHQLSQFPIPSKRTMQCRDISKGKKVVFLSGSPVTESMAQIYHQLWVLGDKSPLHNFESFTDFADKYCKVAYNKSTRKLDYSNVTDDFITELKKIRDDHFLIRSQKDNGFTRQSMDEIVKIKCSNKLSKFLENMSTNSCIINNGELVLAKNRADLKMKRLQLSSGTVRSENKRYIIDTFKAEYIRNNYKGLKKAIIYKYIAELEMLKKFFPNYTASWQEFQNNKYLTFLGQVQSCKEGTTLDSADILIFMTISPSGSDYIQARERIMSKNRTKDAKAVWLMCDDINSPEMDIFNKIKQEKEILNNFFYD